MPPKKAELIVALDVDTLEEMRRLMDTLSPVADIFKVGSQLFTACGPTAVKLILSRGKKVFLDLKYHDIPNTVASAVRSAVGLGINLQREEVAYTYGVFMLTVHVVGGKEMLEMAVKAAQDKAKDTGIEKPLIVGITVLTSETKKDSIKNLVLERALLAKSCGLDGVVASGEEAALIREKTGPSFIIVTPGIRSSGGEANDQKRIVTPAQAIKNGSNFLVVGRPIVAASDPISAAKKIIDEINSTK